MMTDENQVPRAGGWVSNENVFKALLGLAGVTMTAGIVQGMRTIGMEKKQSEEHHVRVKHLVELDREHPDSVVLGNALVYWPSQLRSDDKKTVDLTNVEQVAKAMGVTLNGQPDQPLFTMELATFSPAHQRDIQADSMQGRRPLGMAQIVVTPENLKEAANLINSIEKPFIEKWTKTMYPSSQPAGGKSRG